jgi:hypothetical protein
MKEQTKIFIMCLCVTKEVLVSERYVTCIDVMVSKMISYGDRDFSHHHGQIGSGVHPASFHTRALCCFPLGSEAVVA